MEKLIHLKNSRKILFTPGPPSLSKANLMNLNPAFGRNDKSYLRTEKKVLSKIKKLSGHKNIITTQGAGSTVLEMVALNFLRGKVLIVSTGYYSDRLYNLALMARRTHNFIKEIDKIDWNKLTNIKKKYDWIWACYTETSCGLKLSMKDLKKLSKSSKSRLAIDATASFGLENSHKDADVVSFSSCKGLLGLTGAGFICYNQTLKKFKDYISLPKKNQPLLCTYLNCKVKGTNKKVVLYKPRVKLPGSIICHLGEAHLGAKAKGKILNYLVINEKK